MGLRVLLITQHRIQKILVDAIFDVHARCVQLKKVHVSICCYDASFTKKKVHGKILVSICTMRTICSLRDHVRKDDWVNF
jgi:hypothetical protein